MDDLLARVRRERARDNAITWSGRGAVALAALALWQIGAARLGSFWIAGPGEVFARMRTMLADGSLLHDTWITTQEMLSGLVIGSIVGVLIGVLLARSRRLGHILEPYIILLFAIPHLALAPLLIMWLGIGLKSKIFLVALTVFFYMFLNTFAGVRAVNPELINSSLIMGATRWQLATKLLLPSAVVWIFTGLRLAIRQALAAAVIGEYIASSAGIGWLINSSSGTFDTTGVFVGLVVLAIVAGIVYVLASLVEKRFVRWEL